ncbi:MAG: ABC transporter substrate-binding protein [Eubacteriales bacterium]|nr:ABC transporter substrate-binding protein [Eubacteriales bacterium]
MKRLVCALLCAMLLLFACAQAEEMPVRVASLKGPTSMGLVKLMQDAKEGASANEYTFAVEGTADAIAPLLVRGELDIALVPCNLASVLYNNTKGAVQVVAINTLGVLYVVEAGETVNRVEDLAGKTIYSTGKGTTPEFALNYVLEKNGLDPEKDVTVEFKSEATEVASALLNDAAAIAVLPQPYVTAVLAQNQDLRVALSLTEEWDRVGDGSAMITGVAIVRTEFAQQNPQAVADFLKEYAASTEYVNENPAEAAVWIEELEIAKAAIAEKAIPACNIVCISGAEMMEKVSGYLSALYAQNPEAVGGTLPDEAFYYLGEVA